MTRCLAWLAVSLVLSTACLSVAPRERHGTVGVRGERPNQELSPYPAGRCGGLGELDLGEPVSLLVNRLFLRLPTGARQAVPGHNIMAAGAPNPLERSAWVLGHGDARLTVTATELFRRKPNDLRAALEAEYGEGHTLESVPGGEGLEVFALVPAAPDRTGENVTVMTAFVVGPDSMIQHVRFHVDPVSATEPGCQRLGLKLVATLLDGGRRLARARGGPHGLWGNLWVDLPPGYRVIKYQGVDSTVFRVVPDLAFGSTEGWLDIYFDRYATLDAPSNATQSPGTILGTSTSWHEWSEEGTTRREALDGSTKLSLAANDAELINALTQVADSLTQGTVPPATTECPAPRPLPEIADVASLHRLSPLHVLSQAEEVTFHRQTWSVPRVNTTEAFLALLRHPRGRDAFLLLAQHESPVARLYGLAGLTRYDRDLFTQLMCQQPLRETTPIRERTLCGTQPGTLAEVLTRLAENPRAQRARAPALPSDSRAALRTAVVGFAEVLQHGPEGNYFQSRNVALLSGDRHTPPLHPENAVPTLPSPWVEADRSVTALARNSGVCQTRRDGRVACWDFNAFRVQWPSNRALLLPLPIRWPAALVHDWHSGCALDAEGQRICFALLDRALDARKRDCPNALRPRGFITRTFSDGPWRTLGTTYSSVCGVHQEGNLYCFSGTPEWATAAESGLGAAYHVPIEGNVVGMTRGPVSHGYAWTEDGTLWSWTESDPPSPFGRVENAVEYMVGFSLEPLVMARTSDGRVFAYRDQDQRDGLDRILAPTHPDRMGPSGWIEMTNLRDHRVYLEQQHACTLSPTGRAMCWGDDGLHAPVEALEGIQSLEVGLLYTCAIMPNGRYRCAGSQLDRFGPRRQRRNGLLALNPSQLAESID